MENPGHYIDGDILALSVFGLKSFLVGTPSPRDLVVSGVFESQMSTIPVPPSNPLHESGTSVCVVPDLGSSPRVPSSSGETPRQRSRHFVPVSAIDAHPASCRGFLVRTHSVHSPWWSGTRPCTPSQGPPLGWGLSSLFLLLLQRTRIVLLPTDCTPSVDRGRRGAVPRPRLWGLGERREERRTVPRSTDLG